MVAALVAAPGAEGSPLVPVSASGVDALSGVAVADGLASRPLPAVSVHADANPQTIDRMPAASNPFLLFTMVRL